MIKKVDTVKRELKKETVTHYHVLVGGHPVRTFADADLAQHYAVEEKSALVRRGCDLSQSEFHVVVEEETKERDVYETVTV